MENKYNQKLWENGGSEKRLIKEQRESIYIRRGQKKTIQQKGSIYSLIFRV